jgi:hypothetical protein
LSGHLIKQQSDSGLIRLSALLGGALAGVYYTLGLVLQRQFELVAAMRSFIISSFQVPFAFVKGFVESAGSICFGFLEQNVKLLT